MDEHLLVLAGARDLDLLEAGGGVVGDRLELSQPRALLGGLAVLAGPWRLGASRRALDFRREISMTFSPTPRNALVAYAESATSLTRRPG